MYGKAFEKLIFLDLFTKKIKTKENYSALIIQLLFGYLISS
jgi:hypothetical protein